MSIGLPKGMGRDDAYVAGLADGRKDTIKEIRQRIKRWRETYTQMFPADLDRIIKQVSEEAGGLD